MRIVQLLQQGGAVSRSLPIHQQHCRSEFVYGADAGDKQGAVGEDDAGEGQGVFGGGVFADGVFEFGGFDLPAFVDAAVFEDGVAVALLGAADDEVAAAADAGVDGEFEAVGRGLGFDREQVFSGEAAGGEILRVEMGQLMARRGGVLLSFEHAFVSEFLRVFAGEFFEAQREDFGRIVFVGEHIERPGAGAFLMRAKEEDGLFNGFGARRGGGADGGGEFEAVEFEGGGGEGCEDQGDAQDGRGSFHGADSLRTQRRISRQRGMAKAPDCGNGSTEGRRGVLVSEGRTFARVGILPENAQCDFQTVFSPIFLILETVRSSREMWILSVEKVRE